MKKIIYFFVIFFIIFFGKNVVATEVLVAVTNDIPIYTFMTDNGNIASIHRPGFMEYYIGGTYQGNLYGNVNCPPSGQSISIINGPHHVFISWVCGNSQAFVSVIRKSDGLGIYSGQYTYWGYSSPAFIVEGNNIAFLTASPGGYVGLDLYDENAIDLIPYTRVSSYPPLTPTVGYSYIASLNSINWFNESTYEYKYRLYDSTTNGIADITTDEFISTWAPTTYSLLYTSSGTGSIAYLSLGDNNNNMRYYSNYTAGFSDYVEKYGQQIVGAQILLLEPGDKTALNYNIDQFSPQIWHGSDGIYYYRGNSLYSDADVEGLGLLEDGYTPPEPPDEGGSLSSLYEWDKNGDGEVSIIEAITGIPGFLYAVGDRIWTTIESVVDFIVSISDIFTTNIDEPLFSYNQANAGLVTDMLEDNPPTEIEGKFGQLIRYMYYSLILIGFSISLIIFYVIIRKKGTE